MRIVGYYYSTPYNARSRNQSAPPSVRYSLLPSAHIVGLLFVVFGWKDVGHALSLSITSHHMKPLAFRTMLRIVFEGCIPEL
jgi:hypothetical protein